jgi:hypothetical protein
VTPSSDDEIRKWLAEQPGVENVEISRDAGDLHIRYRLPFWRQGPGLREFSAAFERSGYKGFQKSALVERTVWRW